MGKRAVADVEERGYAPDADLQKIIDDSIRMIENNQDASNGHMFDKQYATLSTAYNAWDQSHKGFFWWIWTFFAAIIRIFISSKTDGEL
jgi:hypothetical protein